jgi:hypothetical protein
MFDFQELKLVRGFVLFCFNLFFETEFHYVAQASLELWGSNDLPASASQVLGL